MKKAFYIIIMVIFLIPTVGITINKHYSGGELFSTSLFSAAESCCEEPCECCDDKTEVFRLTAQYLFSTILSELKIQVPDSAPADYIEESFNHSKERKYHTSGISFSQSVLDYKTSDFLSKLQTFLL